MQRFENRDMISFFGQIARAGQAGRSCTDDSDAMSVCLRLADLFVHVFPIPVGDKAFQPSDGDAFSLFAAHAFALALRFLRADTAADRRQRAGFMNDMIGLFKFAFLDCLDEFRNVDRDRTAAHTRLGGAVQAALCFLTRHLLRIAQRDLLEVRAADHRILDRHLDFLQRHVRHVMPPPSETDCMWLRALCFPHRDKRCCGPWPHRNRPDVRQNPVRPRRRTSSLRLR